MPAPSATAASSHGSIEPPWPAARLEDSASSAGAKFGGAGTVDGSVGAAGLVRMEFARSDELDGVPAAAGGAASRGAGAAVLRATPASRSGTARRLAEGASVAAVVVLPAAGGRQTIVAAGGGVSAGRVTVPPRLKFWSSRGPTVSWVGLPVADGGGAGGTVCVVFCPVACPVP